MMCIKQILAVLLLLVMLCMTIGCADSGIEITGNADESQQLAMFSIPKQQQQMYVQQMEDVLKSFYWRYDMTQLLFSERELPAYNTQWYTDFYKASTDADLNPKGTGGSKAVIVSCRLLHFNGDAAGKASFCFVQGELVGAYHYPDYDPDAVYSLKDRNLFVVKTQFPSYERTEVTREYTKSNLNTVIPITGFSFANAQSSGLNYLFALDNDTAKIFKYDDDRFSTYKTIQFMGEDSGLLPMSAAFLPSVDREPSNDIIAILLGTQITLDTDSESFYEKHTQNESILLSKKVVFYDGNFKRLDYELTLGSETYSIVNFDGEDLIISNNNTLEYYKRLGGRWEKDNHILLTHNVEAFLRTSINNDGVDYYFMSDGMDLYMYKKNMSSFSTVWRTHLSIDSLDGNMYSADLNGDGVNEIYVTDTTGTNIRYIVTQKGLVSQNEDILYGERIYPGDFDGDGIYEYIKMYDAEHNVQDLYVGIAH